MGMKERIDYFLQKLSEMTKDEADFTQHICTWDNDDKAAFLFAKRIFEENMDDTDE